jgi:hypothetical protein
MIDQPQLPPLAIKADVQRVQYLTCQVFVQHHFAINCSR